MSVGYVVMLSGLRGGVDPLWKNGGAAVGVGRINTEIEHVVVGSLGSGGRIDRAVTAVVGGPRVLRDRARGVDGARPAHRAACSAWAAELSYHL